MREDLQVSSTMIQGERQKKSRFGAPDAVCRFKGWPDALVTPDVLKEGIAALRLGLARRRVTRATRTRDPADLPNQPAPLPPYPYTLTHHISAARGPGNAPTPDLSVLQ